MEYTSRSAKEHIALEVVSWDKWYHSAAYTRKDAYYHADQTTMNKYSTNSSFRHERSLLDSGLH